MSGAQYPTFLSGDEQVLALLLGCNDNVFLRRDGPQTTPNQRLASMPDAVQFQEVQPRWERIIPSTMMTPSGL